MTALVQPMPPPQRTAAVLRWSAIALTGVVWASSAIFGVYILAFFGGAIPAGAMEQWNESLPNLYAPSTPAASAGIGAHFFAGAALLLLGPIQLIGEVRSKAPVVHRWIGRVYAFAAVLAGVGGLVFILAKGAVGGWMMNLAFAAYGALMVFAGVETVRHALARRIETHRAWAIRLFALAIGSWLYRMCYGLFFAVMGLDDPGHTDAFSGWFDYVMDWAFFVPPLIVAELFIRARRAGASAAARMGAAAAMSLGAVLIAYATYVFTALGWGPAILMRFGAAA